MSAASEESDVAPRVGGNRGRALSAAIPTTGHASGTTSTGVTLEVVPRIEEQKANAAKQGLANDRPLQRIIRSVDIVAPHESPHKVHRAEEIALRFAKWRIRVTAERLEALNPPVDRGIGRVGPAKFAAAIEHLMKHVGARHIWLHVSGAGSTGLRLDGEGYYYNYHVFVDALAQVRRGGAFTICWER